MIQATGAEEELHVQYLMHSGIFKQKQVSTVSELEQRVKLAPPYSDSIVLQVKPSKQMLIFHVSI